MSHLADYDALRRWWYRLTYCTRHGHYKVHDGVCLNCGKRVIPPGETHG